MLALSPCCFLFAAQKSEEWSGLVEQSCQILSLRRQEFEQALPWRILVMTGDMVSQPPCGSEDMSCNSEGNPLAHP